MKCVQPCCSRISEETVYHFLFIWLWLNMTFFNVSTACRQGSERLHNTYNIDWITHTLLSWLMQFSDMHSNPLIRRKLHVMRIWNRMLEFPNKVKTFLCLLIQNSSSFGFFRSFLQRKTMDILHFCSGLPAFFGLWPLQKKHV